jgi:hypothetical protein
MVVKMASVLNNRLATVLIHFIRIHGTAKKSVTADAYVVMRTEDSRLTQRLQLRI